MSAASQLGSAMATLSIKSAFQPIFLSGRRFYCNPEPRVA
jgi:hypothetical protein